MTAYVAISRPSSDAYSDAEVAAAVAVLPTPPPPPAPAPPGTMSCGSYSRLAALMGANATTLGLTNDAVEYLSAVYPINTGHGWVRGGNDGGKITSRAWVLLHDPATYTGGVLQLQADDGSTLTPTVGKGSIVIADVTRRYQWSAVTAGTCRVLSVLAIRSGANPGATSSLNHSGDGGYCW